MATKLDLVSQWLQVRLLQGIGTTLRALSVFSSSQKDRFHPPGFGRITRWLGEAIFHPDRRYVFRFGQDRQARFSFPLNDPYWTAVLLPGREYETEVRQTLSRVLVRGTALLDCGANLGYWSCFAATFLSPRDIVAIEPFPSTFDQLILNAQLNGGFQCVQAAVHRTDGLRVWLAGRETAIVQIRDRVADSGDPGVWAPTISLDTVCREYVRSDRLRLVLKLDVEGAEIAALEGAGQVLQRRPLLIYEDHGSDSGCALSQHISSRLGWQIYSWFPGRGFQSVQIPEIRATKRNPRVGYNFIACADPRSWPELGVAASSLR
jgi:FkbM family methyltransferase